MNTAPIINVINVASSSAAPTKASGSVNSSDQSFGQVLSREVNGHSNADNSANGSPNSTPASAPSSSGSADGKTTTKAKTDDKSSQSADASSAAPANTDASSASASAQMLALVSNVQQATPMANNDASASNKTVSDALTATKAAGATVLPQAQALPGNIQAITTPVDNAAASASAKAPLNAEAALKNIAPANPSLAPTPPGTDTNLANIVQASEKQNLTASRTEPAATTAIPLDLTATAEKNIQAGLAALDTNEAKIEQTAQVMQAAQPAAIATVAQQAVLGGQALQSNANDKITPQVGSANWDQAVGQKVVWMVAGGQQNASLTLNPPDLGPMQVVLNVTNSHATVTFTAAQPEVRHALENAMPKLREMLGDAGIQLGQASINSGSAQQQNAPAQQTLQNSRQLDAGTDSIETTISSTRTAPTAVGIGLVDTFA